MPELPEVETIARGLQNKVSGKTIQDIRVRYSKIFRDCCGQPYLEEERKQLIASLTGKTIKAVTRRAKYLLFDLGDILLVSHLRMTGRFSSDPEYVDKKHTHVVLTFTDGSVLSYNDTRKFGTIQIITCEEERLKTTMSRSGIEPLSDAFSADYLFDMLKQSKRNIKAFLLTQESIAGIGNIYADEILFFAAIDPKRRANSISEEEAIKLHRGIKEKLMMGIASGGASILTYVNESGDKGAFQELLQVYGKKGCHCQICNQKLLTETVAARTTTYCPYCQT